MIVQLAHDRTISPWSYNKPMIVQLAQLFRPELRVMFIVWFNILVMEQ